MQPAPCSAPLALGAVPITAGVVGDLRLRASRAAQRVTAERSAAAVLHSRHDLELAETEMAALLVSPGRPVGAEDVRDLQACHGCGLRGLGRLQRTDHLAQGLGGHLGIERGGLELLVAEQDLDGADVFLLLEQVSGKGMA